MKDRRMQQLESIFKEHGMVMKTAALTKSRVFSKEISQLVSKGTIVRVKTGFYVWADALHNFSDVELAAAVLPGCVVCLHSAAAYYDFTTIIPTAVCIAASYARKAPVLPQQPRVTLYRFTEAIFDIGITEHQMTFSKVRMYDRERTVCDFMRMRSQFGDDLALEVLQNYMRGPKNLQKLFQYAQELKIRTVLRPYVEALI